MNMNLMSLRWYGPEFKTLYERGQVKKLLKEYCGECDEKFFVFGMIYNAPIKENYGFFVGNRLFMAIQHDRALLVVEDDYIKIKHLLELWDTTPRIYEELHYHEEFQDYLLTRSN